MSNMASTTLVPVPGHAAFAVDEPGAEQLTALRLERDVLTHKLARLGNATHALAAELAATRRALRAERDRVARLTTENARLRAGGLQ